MAKEHKYLDDTLIRLRRKYNKDEVVNILNKKISDSDIIIGKLTSEIDHLSYENSNLINNKNITKKAKILAKKEILYNMQIETNKKLCKKINKLKKDNNDLICKCAKLQMDLKKYE